MAEQHLFSTGTLFASVPYFGLSGQQRAVGGAYSALPTISLPQLGPQTQFVTNTNYTNSSWAIIDLGAVNPISSVTLLNASDTLNTGGIRSGVSVWVTNSSTAIPGDGSTTQLGAISISGTPGPCVALPVSGLSVSGRYLLITCAQFNGAMGFGGIQVFGAPIEFALVQSANIEIGWDDKPLYGAAMVAEFPMDIGFDQARLRLRVGNAGVRADSLQLAVASQLAGTTTITETLPQTVKLPAMRAVLTTKDTNGRAIIFTLNNCRAKGANWPFKLNDFLIEQIELSVYPDVSGNVGTVVFS